ncbi:MAG TPA: N-isopropylammelide isopropyl amidohydrolase, partial [Jiangellaceae bacterium]
MAAQFELVIGNAVLREKRGRHSIGINDGRITAITKDSLRGRVEIDAGGNLVTESFVNAHLHLCKVYTL